MSSRVVFFFRYDRSLRSNFFTSHYIKHFFCCIVMSTISGMKDHEEALPDYTIMSQLGSGHTGIVLLCEHVKDGHKVRQAAPLAFVRVFIGLPLLFMQVAVKVVHRKEGSKSFAKNLRREIVRQRWICAFFVSLSQFLGFSDASMSPECHSTVRSPQPSQRRLPYYGVFRRQRALLLHFEEASVGDQVPSALSSNCRRA